ncbi:hypothetical protein Tco_0922147 [Tanacetum coccineum]|uniref:Uncharacterized protein n=1 Tax=Tanacetum coccineum TaxID=301880 RepID=A0ABQ5CZN1_9ASTR
MKILSIIRISVDEQFGYGYLTEIVVRRVDQKEYVLKEANFPKLHLNEIKDMYLLSGKTFNLGWKVIKQSLIICDNLDLKEPYTILLTPRGVVYLNKNNRKYLMMVDELYKFSDGILNPVYDILNSTLHNFELGYNFHVGKDQSNVAEKSNYEELRVFCWWKKNRDGLQTANADIMTLSF